jgi:aminoglycoside N3'-acetyltransferase
VGPIDRLLAVGERAGRWVAERRPELRQRAAERVRRSEPAREGVAAAELRECVRALGLEPGRDLLVHSSFAGMRQVELKLPEWIDWLRELCGPEATLLMPTHPVTKVEDGLPVYDVARSPSSVGFLPERLRRTPGARRSPFPIAPACALGPRAELYARDFRDKSGGTAYGIGSPYHTLGEVGGQCLFLGIDFIRTLTLEHVAFDVLGPENPVADYYQEESFWVVRGGERERFDVRHHRKELTRYLATFAMRRMALRSGTVRTANLKGVRVGVLDAEPFLAWHRLVARRHGLPYFAFPRARRGGP